MSETIIQPFIEPDNERTIRRSELTAMQAQSEHHTARERLFSMAEHMVKALEEERSTVSRNILQLMQHCPPQVAMAAGGQEFFVSQQLATNRRNYAVAYTIDEQGNVAQRLFYKSASEGNWRSAPLVYDDNPKQKLHISKGEELDAGYVRETRIVDDLREQLQAQEPYAQEVTADTEKWILQNFTKSALGNRNTYADVVDETKLRKMPDAAFRFAPGEGFVTFDDEKSPAEQLAQLELDADIKPEFDRPPKKVTTSTHSILGEVTTEVYDNTYGNLLWHISSDTQGRVWLSGITKSQDMANSYGVSEDVLIGGVFDNKPLEYDSQVQGLREGIDYVAVPGNNTYVDITPLLGNLPIIKEYKQKRSLAKNSQVPNNKNPALITGIPEHLK